MRHTLTFSAAAVLATASLAVGLIGCDDQETAQYPPQPTMTVQPPPPPAMTAAPQPSGGQAMVLPPAAGIAVAPVLQGSAEKETQGMNPDGPPVLASFMQGQYHEQDFTIQPGRCYTIVGVGMGVGELDIQVVTNQPPVPPTTIAQDDRSGAQSVVGGAGACHRTASPVPIPVKVRTTATAGSGIVMVQIYSKN